MHISTIIHVHVSHTPCLSAATAPGGDLSKMLLPDKTGGETTMVNGEYDCAPMLATGTKGQNIGPNRHPLRECAPHTASADTRQHPHRVKRHTHLEALLLVVLEPDGATGCSRAWNGKPLARKQPRNDIFVVRAHWHERRKRAQTTPVHD